MSKYEQLSEHEKEMRRKASRAYGQRNRKKGAFLLKQWCEKRMVWFNSLKEGKSCQICGESHIACLDYHHRNPLDKSRLPRQIARSTSDDNKVLQEIVKCDLICANCHRKIHYERSEK